MLEKPTINTRQFILMVIFYIVGTSILLAPSLLASNAKQDAWIAAFLGVGMGLLIVRLYTTLGNLYPNMTLVEYSEKVLGKWFGKILSLFFFVYLFILSALVLRNIGDFMTIELMPETPIVAILILFMSIVIIGTRLGLEVLARSAEIFFPWVIILFLILVLSISPQVKVENVQPVFEEGMKPVLEATIPFLSFPFFELVVFLMFFPFINQPKKIGKAFSIGEMSGGTLIVLIVILNILVLGTDMTERHIYPTYILSKKINVGNFLTRIEVIVAVIWIISIYFKLTICYYASIIGLAQILNLRDYRVLTLPLTIILIVLSLEVTPNIIHDLTVVPKIMTSLGLIFGFLLPLFLLGISLFRKNIEQKKKQNC